MISIIISSYLPQYFSALEINIAETIGIPYEIIKIDNNGVMGICEAYNNGAAKAKYGYLLFTHEDLVFRTHNWGNILVDHLKPNGTGIIGLAGSSYVPYAPSSWTVDEKHNFVNILQGNRNNSEYSKLHTTIENRNKVFAVDGVFMAIRKENYLQFTFNEELLKGFHGYDLDFSLRVSEKLQNYVIDDILIQHFSSGNLDKNWLDANIKVRENIKFNFQKKKDPEIEKKIFSGFLYNYFRYYPINRKNILRTLRFYPKGLNCKDHLEFAKKYFKYIKYAGSINKKLGTNT